MADEKDNAVEQVIEDLNRERINIRTVIEGYLANTRPSPQPAEKIERLLARAAAYAGVPAANALIAELAEALRFALTTKPEVPADVRERVERAYKEGWMVNSIPPDEHDAGPAYVHGCCETDWQQSKTRAALEALSQSSKGDVERVVPVRGDFEDERRYLRTEELGCDYCNNGGPLIEQPGWTPRCPRCDAEYPTPTPS